MVGVLLMIRLNAEHRRLMARRRTPCLDDYLDRVNLLLWPRFKVAEGGAVSRAGACAGHVFAAACPEPATSLLTCSAGAYGTTSHAAPALTPLAPTHLQVLWDMQHASIKAGAERQLFSGDAAPCATVKRYAALTASVLRLMAHHDEEDGARPPREQLGRVGRQHTQTLRGARSGTQALS